MRACEPPARGRGGARAAVASPRAAPPRSWRRRARRGEARARERPPRSAGRLARARVRSGSVHAWFSRNTGPPLVFLCETVDFLAERGPAARDADIERQILIGEGPRGGRGAGVRDRPPARSRRLGPGCAAGAVRRPEL